MARVSITALLNAAEAGRATRLTARVITGILMLAMVGIVLTANSNPEWNNVAITILLLGLFAQLILIIWLAIRALRRAGRHLP